MIFGVLVFVVGALLVANVWTVIDAKLMVSAASREATRSYVEAPDSATAIDRAATAADLVRSGHGRKADAFSLNLTAAEGFNRCASVEFEASYDVDLISVPFLGGFGRGLTVEARHREIIDPFRSGVGGVADCG